MAGGTFGGSIKLTGESEYRSALRNITQSLREVSSELKLTAAQYSNNDKSLNTLKSKQEALNNTLSKQAKQVETARNAYEKFKAKVDEQAKAHDKLEKEYQEAQAKLEELKGTSDETSQEYQEQKAKVEELANAVGKSNTANEQNENALSKLKTTLNNTETAYAQTENQLNELNEEVKQAEEANKAMANSENDNRTATQKLNDKISEQEEKLAQLKEAYKEASLKGAKEEADALGKEIQSLSSELVENKNKMSELDNQADNLDNSLKEVGDSANNAEGGFTVLKGALANLASNAISSVIDKLKDMAVQTINTGKEFDEKMSNVVAISGATGKDFEALRQKAISMGASTKFSAGESADALGYMAMAGWKTNDMLDGLGGIMDLAAASGADLATTSDIVTDALTAFGKSAKDSGRLADIMAATSSNANTNVNLMGETFKYCASTAGSLGYSMEDTSIAIGLMANSGVKGSQAGTSLKNILVNLSKPTAQMKKAMTELGISLTDSSGKMKPLSQVMNELREKFGKLSASQKAQYASTLAGKEGMAGLLAIVNASPKDFDKLTKAVNGSDGSAKKMAKTMADNLGGDLENLGGHLETVQIQLYDKFEPALRKAVDALDGLLDAVEFVVNHSSEFTTAITAMAAGLGAYVAYTTALQIMKNGFMSLTIVTKAQAVAQAALNAVMSLNPVGIVIAGIVALVVAFVALWNKSESFRNFWIGLWDSIKSVATTALNAIKSFISTAWNTIKSVTTTVWNGIKSVITTVWNGIKSTVTTVINAVKSVITTVWNGIKSVTTTVWNGIKSVVTTVWNGIKSTVTTVVNAVKSVITTVWNAIKTATTTVWNAIKTAVTTPINVVKSTVTTVVNAVKSVVTTVWSAIKTATTTVWNAIKTGVTTPINAVKSTVTTVVNAVKSTVTTVWNAIKSVTTGVWNGIKSAIENPMNAAKNAVKNVIDSIKGFFNFKISWPHIPLPHFSISPAGWSVGDLLKGKIPTLGINWYARGGVFDKGARVLTGVGENGAEAVVPLENNTKWIRKVADEMRGYIIDALSVPQITIDKPNESESIDKKSYNKIVEAFKEALGDMNVKLDEEKVGKFVKKTVSDAIYT